MNDLHPTTLRAITVLLSLALAGCGEPASPTQPARQPRPAAQPPAHTHGKGPNGGVVFDLGKHHAELTVDHGKQEAAILILGDDETTIVPVAAPELTLSTRPTKTKDGTAVPALSVKLLPRDVQKGKASRFTGNDPGLAVAAEFAGAVTGVIDGKPAQGEFKE